MLVVGSYMFLANINYTNTLKIIKLSISLDAITSLFGETRKDRRGKLCIDT